MRHLQTREIELHLGLSQSLNRQGVVGDDSNARDFGVRGRLEPLLEGLDSVQGEARDDHDDGDFVQKG